METKENKYGTSCQSQETKVAASKGSLHRTFVIITENVVKKHGNSVTTLPDYLQQGCHAWLPLNEMAPKGQGIIIINIALSDAKLLLNRKAFLPKHFIYGRAESRHNGTGKDGFLVEIYERRDDTNDYAVTQTEHICLQEINRSGECASAAGMTAFPVSWEAVQEAFSRYEKTICQMKSKSEKYRTEFDRCLERTLEENKTGYHYYLWRGMIYHSFSTIYPTYTLSNMGILSKKGILSESSFNRLLSWIKNYEIAFITAFRSIKENILHDDLTKEDSKKIGDVYSKSENRERNRELGASLLRMGYGITKISGANIANFGNPNSGIADEESFLVVNIKDDNHFYDNMFKLSEYYNQDCFCYKPKGEEVAYNIGTNGNDYLGYNQKDCNGKFVHGVINEFISRLKNRGFAFTDNDNLAPFHTSHNDRKKERINKKIEQAINEEIKTFDDYNVLSKQTIANIGDPIIREIIILPKKSDNLVKMEK